MSVYIPVNATSGNDLVRLFAMVGGGYANPQPINDVQDYGLVANYTWNIQVRQIDCTSGHPLQAPPGCLQYFNQPTDTIGDFLLNVNIEHCPHLPTRCPKWPKSCHIAPNQYSAT